MNKQFLLASKSPRRKELLKLLDIDFTIKASDICEDLKEGLTNEEIVMDLAFQKAEHIYKDNREKIVLGFDTLVILDGILGENLKEVFYDHADVVFNKMTDEEINEYLDTDEPYDKAGAYGIQGVGARYILGIEGDYYSVMGVPLQKLYNKLRDLK